MVRLTAYQRLIRIFGKSDAGPPKKAVYVCSGQTKTLKALVLGLYGNGRINYIKGIGLEKTMVKTSRKLRSLPSIAHAVVLGLAVTGFAAPVSAGILDAVKEGVANGLNIGEDTAVTESSVGGGLQNYTDTGSNPFNIIVDGVPVYGDPNLVNAEDDRRTLDVGLEAMDIAIQVDVEDLDRAANVEAIRRSVGRNAGNVQFFTYWNYGAFIKSAEVRIFRADQSVDANPVEVISVQPGRATVWQSTDRYGSELQYVLRLTGDKGRFDETEPKQLNVDASQKSSGDEEDIAREALAVYGKNRLTTENIEVTGGSVTVSGKSVPIGHRVFVMGVPAPVSRDNEFVAREILPAGNHNVIVAVLDGFSKGLEFQRNLEIAANDWFYVGVGDLTVGTNKRSGPVELTGISGSDDNKSVDVVGRAAFFLRGKIQGKYLLTALADTTEDELSNLLSNVTSRNPVSLLDRIDPDRFYPIYGDDSTVKDLAPAQGNLYAKIEAGDSHILWGSYRTQIVGAELGQIRRSLYGAQLRYHSEEQTASGEHRFKLEGFAAQPQSLPQTDELRGTGGSVYFLKRQDLTIGGETLRVEVRNPVTGVVAQSRKLVKDEDYTIDYIQGRIILSKALAYTSDDGFIVSNGKYDDMPQYLVARYEYSPALTDFDGYAVGGRAEAWLGDILRVGGTAHYQDATYAKKKLYAADALVQLNAGTYVKGEYAQSEGVGDSTTTSSDGGYDTLTTNRATTGNKASAYRLEAGVDLGAVTSLKGAKASAYYKFREAGFSGEGQETDNDLSDVGVAASIPVGQFLNVRGNYNLNTNKTTGKKTTAAKADIDITLAKRLNAGLGIGYTTDTAGDDRLDVGGRIGLKLDDYEAYAFGQTTVNKSGTRTRNARVGIGAKAKLTDRLSLGGEVSTGDGGLGGRASVDYQISDRTTSYLAYETANRTNTGTGSANSGQYNNANIGTLTFGGKSRFTDALTVYGEERVTHAERGVTALTHAYGIDYAPSDAWKFGANFEHGDVKDTADKAIKRTAVSGTAEFSRDGFNAGGGLEARFDKNEADKTQRKVYLARAKSSLKFNPNWRLQAQLNVVISKAGGTFGDGEFIDGSIGFAYRPIENDRLNALFKYQAFYDLPGSKQVTGSGSGVNYKQRSHIISADAVFELTRQLSIGAKYGLKMGSVTSSRSSDDWRDSTLHLGILRADWHVVKNWDATVELRALNHVQNKNTRVGALAAIYRHFGDNLKLGVGYNFSNVSDNLTNVDAKTQGVFVNAITKF